jgi:NAD(P)-dependent dehydrogenase (short-subunit alcohol dehydrogenase family)
MRWHIEVTGGCGAVGLAIAEAVIESGADVVLLDTSQPPATVTGRLGFATSIVAESYNMQSNSIASRIAIKRELWSKSAM